MTRRDLLSAFGISFAAWRTAAGDAAGQGKDEKKPTRATVTLAIDGMTWEGCIEPVRSALLSVKGVTRAQVSLQDHEAVVTYDPNQCTVEDMIKAVAQAEGVETPGQYTASVKKTKKKP